MNIAITDGLVLMPPAFAEGLDLWSPEDGLVGQATFDSSGDAILIASDSDFGPCIEIQASSDTQKIRYTGETPLQTGSYLEVRARVKVLSGGLPSVRVGGWAGDSAGDLVASADATGPSTALTEYGTVYEISAIVGGGDRTGVDMVWGGEPAFGHFGLDILGASGAIVRIDAISIEDVTSVFHRKMMDWVDVRDYGAIGDGVTDDRDAFADADDAADGRTVLVPDGTFYIGSDLTINNPVRFSGTLSANSPGRVIFQKSFNFPTYMDAFKNETMALKAGLRALYNFADHDAFDLCGRRVQLTEPLDVFAAVENKTNFGNRRAIRNGQLEAKSSSAWDPDVVTSSATYDRPNGLKLSNVANISQIAVGSLVEGAGVGREVYVRAVDIANSEITLSQGLHSAATNQTYTFTRFKYLLDYSGFTSIQKQVLEELEFLCNGRASAVMLPPDGWGWHVHHCWFTQPADRGITSIGEGCNGMFIDNNEFYSKEYDDLVGDRTTIGFNTNKADIKVRHNRAVRFKHFGVLAKGGHMILGNHWWQGDDVDLGEKSAGIVITQKNAQSVISNNYCDNAFIELTNEHDNYPTNANNPFGALTIIGNTFLVKDAPDWFTFIRISPIGVHTLGGVTVTGNVFKCLNRDIDKVEGVVTASGSFDATQTHKLCFENNGFLGVTSETENPVAMAFTQGSNSNNWLLDPGDHLPFGGQVLCVESVMPIGAVTNSSGTAIYDLPYAQVQQGSAKDQLRLRWPQAVKGKVVVRARSDSPVS